MIVERTLANSLHSAFVHHPSGYPATPRYVTAGSKPNPLALGSILEKIGGRVGWREPDRVDAFVIARVEAEGWIRFDLATADQVLGMPPAESYDCYGRRIIGSAEGSTASELG